MRCSPGRGKAAANSDGAMNAQDNDEPLWVPEDYGRREGVFAVRVDGGSMSEDDSLEGRLRHRGSQPAAA